MPTPQELQEKFWSALKSDMTMMLGLAGVEDSHTRPMSAQLDGEKSPIWFFTSRDASIVDNVGQSSKAFATFTSSDHDLFACVHGKLVIDNDRAMIDKLWNRYVAAWYEQGKDDPKLVLLRFDADEAEIWQDASSLVAGLKMMFGAGDPKQDFKDNVAKVSL